jgi:Uma2 family endonuclease
MQLDEFIREQADQPFELINGERIAKMPQVFGHSYVIRLLVRILDAFTQKHQLGEVFQETTFILPDRYDSNWVEGSRIPDVMFYSADRLADYLAATPEWRERPIPLVPDLVIEVVSPNDSYTKLDEKVDAYLADGVRLVLVVDPQRRKITLDAPDGMHYKLAGDATLDLSAVIAGLTLPLAEIFI